jgi:dsDNA-specific endonuclease/ATPase MutS2
MPEAEAAALQPMDAVYVQRFGREGRVVRVKADKKLVVVSMGLLEVEVPFDGLARARAAGKPAPKPHQAKDKTGE